MRSSLPVTVLLAVALHAGCAGVAPPADTRASDWGPAPLASADALENGFQRLADQIVAGLRSQQATQIAIVQFQNLDGTVTEFGAFIAEEMTTRLYRAGTFRVVEREMLRQVMAEHELATSGLIDESTAKQLGKLLGVDAITAGSVTDLGNEVRINSRLIATETGSVFSAAAVTLPKEERVKNLMAHVLSAPGQAPGARSSEAGTAGRVAPGAGQAATKPGLIGKYYNLGSALSEIPSDNPVFERVDATITCNYPANPVPRVAADFFGIRWTGYLLVEEAGLYTLSFRHDDGLRVWIDGRKVYDQWTFTGGQWRSVDIELPEPGWLPFRADFIELGSSAYCGFRWALPGAADFTDVTADHFRHD